MKFTGADPRNPYHPIFLVKIRPANDSTADTQQERPAPQPAGDKRTDSAAGRDGGAKLSGPEISQRDAEPSWGSLSMHLVWSDATGGVQTYLTDMSHIADVFAFRSVSDRYVNS